MMNARLTKKMLKAMTSEELQAKKDEIVEMLANTTENKDRNILQGFIGMIEVEASTRKPAEDGHVINDIPQSVKDTMPDEHDDSELTPKVPVTGEDANGQANKPEDNNGEPKQEDNNDKNEPDKEPEPEVVPEVEHFQLPATFPEVIPAIFNILKGEEDDNTILAKIMKIAEANVDYTNVPLSLCTDAELMRRLKLLWSQRVAANKAKDLAKLDEIEQQEKLINSYRPTKTARTGTVTSENVDHSKLSQSDLQKLIRNYQSKKSNAKKLYEAILEDLKVATEAGAEATIEEMTKEAEQHKNLMEHWQSKVDDASKYRTSTPAGQKNAALVQQIKDTIAALEPMKDVPAVAEKIEQLKKLL